MSSRWFKDQWPCEVTFQSPSSMEITITLPHAGKVTGMGIKKGVTAIVGGGFHGKSISTGHIPKQYALSTWWLNTWVLGSDANVNEDWFRGLKTMCFPVQASQEPCSWLTGTLLHALQLGIYNKVPGDGREHVVCDPGAVKIRAEDGRSVICTDISPFINNLPFGMLVFYHGRSIEITRTLKDTRLSQLNPFTCNQPLLVSFFWGKRPVSSPLAMPLAPPHRLQTSLRPWKLGLPPSWWMKTPVPPTLWLEMRRWSSWSLRTRRCYFFMISWVASLF